jgi:hypothetical protein
MNPAPGLFDMSFTAARSRRRRQNVDSPPEDRLSNSIITRSDHRIPASARGRRSTAPMFFDPEIPTPGWEIYQDPNSQESIEAMLAQPRNMTPAMAGPAAPPFQRDAFGTASREQSDTSSSDSSNFGSPGHRIGPAPDEATRVMLDRMIRTLSSVQADDRRRARRRRRLLLREGRMEEEAAALQADDDGMVDRLQERYAELVLAEEGYDPRIVSANRRQRQREQGQDRALEQEPTDGQAESAAQGQGGDLAQEALETQAQAAEQEHDQLSMPGEIEGGITVGQRIYGPDVRIPSPIESVPDSTSTSTPAETFQPIPTPFTPSPGSRASSMGSGPTFAERARARGRRNLDMEEDGDADGEADADEHTKTKKTKKTSKRPKPTSPVSNNAADALPAQATALTTTPHSSPNLTITIPTRPLTHPAPVPHPDPDQVPAAAAAAAVTRPDTSLTHRERRNRHRDPAERRRDNRPASAREG